MEHLDIKTARDARKWSQADLAVRVGVQPNTIARIERGEQAPRVPLAIKIAAALDTTVEVLFGDLALAADDDTAGPAPDEAA